MSENINSTTPASTKSDEQAAARKAAQAKKKAKSALKKLREARGTTVHVAKAAGTKVTVTVTVEDAKPAPAPVPQPEEVISDVKREVLRFENSRYAMAYGRPRTPWAYAARKGCRRIR